MDIQTFWDRFDLVSTPDLLQLTNAMKTLPGHIPQLTDDYIRLQRLYQFLFGLCLTGKGSLELLDKRLVEHGCLGSEDIQEDAFAGLDMMGLRCFYLRTLPRVERLDEKGLAVLRDCLEQRDEDTLRKAMELVESTLEQVMAVSPDMPETWFQLYPSIGGEGRVLGKHIVLMMRTSPAYDAQGMITNWDADAARVRMALSVRDQLIPILKDLIPNIHILLTEV